MKPSGKRWRRIDRGVILKGGHLHESQTHDPSEYLEASCDWVLKHISAKPR